MSLIICGFKGTVLDYKQLHILSNSAQFPSCSSSCPPSLCTQKTGALAKTWLCQRAQAKPYSIPANQQCCFRCAKGSQLYVIGCWAWTRIEHGSAPSWPDYALKLKLHWLECGCCNCMSGDGDLHKLWISVYKIGCSTVLSSSCHF